MPRRLALCLLLPAALMASACGGDDGGGGDQEAAAGAEELVGVFKIDPGTCDAAGVTTGSYFRMIQPNGKPGEGPYVPNGDSPCGDKTWAPMKPGTDGGLRTGVYQPYPDPAFDDKGNGTASAVTQPTTWFAVTFAIATNEKDPQTSAATSMPKITAESGKLSGDLSAYAAAWNKQHFNQGAPKPGGERPGSRPGPPAPTTGPPRRTRWTGRARSWAGRSTTSPASGTWRAPSNRRPRGHPRSGPSRSRGACPSRSRSRASGTSPARNTYTPAARHTTNASGSRGCPGRP